ncbi:type VI secretion system-associated protein TagF [Thalassotalea ganghwensis]
MFGIFKKSATKKPAIARFDQYGYLGKTQLRPDFIKFQVNSRESIALDHWLKEGFTYASRQSVQQHNKAKAFGITNMFFMAGNENEASLLGVITPSIDSSGRHYPFASFIHIGQESYRLHPSSLFLNEKSDFGYLIERADAVFHGKSEQEMQTQAAALEQVAHLFKQPSSVTQQLEKFRHIKMSTLWEAVAIDNIEKRAILIQESSLLMQSIANRGCLRSQVGLRFPMPRLSEGFELIAAFWLHLVTVMVADHNWRPWIFYQLGNEHTTPSLTLFTTPVPPSYFDTIWSTDLKSQHLVDFTKVVPSQPLGSAYVDLAKMDHTSMYDALRRWCKA